MSPDLPAHARRATLAAVLAASALVAGCATGPDPRDPFEPFNRESQRFNEEVDRAFLKPVATAYRDFVPRPVRLGVGNFFGNLGDAWSAVNSLLQLRLADASENFMRFSINSTFGLGGLLDIATEAGLERHKEDFGQTLGRWGVPAGPYVMLPIFGPSTLRDSAALSLDMQADPVRAISPDPARYGVLGLRVVDTRANLLRVSSVLEDVALDRYTFTRDAYLQRRRSLVFEGEPPETADEPKE